MGKVTSFPFHFYFIIASVALTLVYLYTFAANSNDAGQAALLTAAAGTFLLMMIIPLLFLVLQALGKLPFSENQPNVAASSKDGLTFGAVGLTLGIFLFFALNIFRVASVFDPKSSVFSQAAAVLDPFFGRALVTVAAPAAEELFFLLGIPLIVFISLDALSSQSKQAWLKNKVVKLVSAIGVSSVMFAYFHVSQQASVDFLKFAIVFRALLMLLVYGDIMFNLIPFAELGIMTAIGYHLANNVVATGGWESWFGLMIGSLPGIVILLWLVSAIYITVNYVLEFGNVNVKRDGGLNG